MNFPFSEIPPKGRNRCFVRKKVFYKLYSMDELQDWFDIQKHQVKNPNLHLFVWRFLYFHYLKLYIFSQMFSLSATSTKNLAARQLKKSSIEPNWSCQALRRARVVKNSDDEVVTSHDLRKRTEVPGNPCILGKSRLVNFFYNLAMIDGLVKSWSRGCSLDIFWTFWSCVEKPWSWTQRIFVGKKSYGTFPRGENKWMAIRFNLSFCVFDGSWHFRSAKISFLDSQPAL